MRIYEEYYKRHLRKMPFVKYNSTGFFIVEKKPAESCNSKFTVVYNRWVEVNSRPGYYSVNWINPIHNANCSFYDVIDSFRFSSIRLEYEQFENYWYETSENIKKNNTKILSDHKEIVMAAWEMFIYHHDEYFTSFLRKTKSNCFDLVFQTLDYTSTIDNRYLSYLDFMERFAKSKFAPLSYWVMDLDCFLSNYSNWFVELAKNDI